MAWLVGLCISGLLARFVVVERALRTASEVGAALGEVGAAPSGEVTPAEEELEALLEPTPPEASEPEEVAAPLATGTTGSVGFAEKRTDVGVSAAEVIAFADAGRVPRGASVPARGGCPAGIRLRDVSGYGLGVVDGDLLVQVNGMPVSERGEVVSAVLAARGRKEPAVEALVLRPRTGCRHGYRVSVAQPYPGEEESPDVGLPPPVPSLERPSIRAGAVSAENPPR